MFAVTFALAVMSPVSVPAQTNDANRNGSVFTSYDDAYNRAGQEGKPILVLFSTQAQPSELQTLKTKGLLNDFLVVVADRNTEAGKRVFAAFNWQAPEGVSVIERTRQWQFARCERKLNGDDLAKLASACRNATGYPTFDPLAPNVSAYPPPAQGNPAQPQAGVVQPGVPYNQFPMMIGGGGCPGGNCGSSCANGNCGGGRRHR